MNSIRYVGLVVLLVGLVVALWFFTQATPLSRAPGSEKSVAEDAIQKAQAVKGMADHRDGEYEEMMMAQ